MSSKRSSSGPRRPEGGKHERAVCITREKRDGKFQALRGPGLFFIIPIVDEITHLIDQRVRVTDVTAESALTRDTVPVDVDAIVFWTVWDAQKSVLEVSDYFAAVALSAQTALRESIGRAELAAMITERERLGAQLRGILDGMSRTMDDARRGGAVPAIAEGVVDAAYWPLLAAWVAVVASFVVLVMLMRRAEPQKGSARMATAAMIAIGAGIAGVLVFRAFTVFLTVSMIPPGDGWKVIFERLMSTSAISALCFAAATAVAAMTVRVRVARCVAVVAVVLSFGVSAATIVTLRDLRARYESFARGDVEPVEKLIKRSFRESPPASPAGR